MKYPCFTGRDTSMNGTKGVSSNMNFFDSMHLYGLIISDLLNFFHVYMVFCLICLADITHLMQMAITSERLHKQSMVIRQICRLFPMRRVVTFSSLTQHIQL